MGLGEDVRKGGTMMEKLIITADLGHFKAYRFITDPKKLQSPRIEPLKHIDLIEARKKMSEGLSDSAGRFRRSDSNRTEGVRAGYGERHNIELENERRLIKAIAENISSLVRKIDPQEWDFAAGDKLNSAVLGELEPPVQKKLCKNLKSNLINASKAELVERFQ
jgi:hypothetical protein